MPTLKRYEIIEISKAEKFAPINPAMSARMLAALHRAASTKSQEQIEQAIGRLGLWGYMTESNRALCSVTDWGK
jgi:hypothetical protein